MATAVLADGFHRVQKIILHGASRFPGFHEVTGDLREDAIASGAVELEVNGIKVTNSTTAWGGTFLKHGAEGESASFPPNEQGRYDIRARAFGEGTFLRLSGIAVW